MKTKILFLITFLVSTNLIVNAQTWTQKAPLPTAGRVHAVGFAIGTKGYVGTGSVMSGTNTVVSMFDDFWEWNQATNVWTQKATFAGGGRYMAVGFSVGAKGYIGTGQTNLSPLELSDFYEYDPAANSWAKKADFAGGPRAVAVGFSIGSKGYIGTGGTGSTFFNDLWEYDPSAGPNGTWVQKANFGGAVRGYAVGFSIGSKGYIGTGGRGFTSYKDFWEFDPSAGALGAWVKKKDFGGVPRVLAVGFSMGGKGYLGCGSPYNTQLKDFWEYDPATDVWTAIQSYGGAEMRDGVAFSIGNNGYVGTGTPYVSKTNATSDLWEYGVPTQTTTCTLSASISSDPSSVCPGGTVGIVASGGTTYSWNTGQITAFIQDTPNVTTTYSVTVRDNAGCTGVASVTVGVINCATAVSEINSVSGRVILSPNPFSESANVIFTGLDGMVSHESDSYRMKIFDVLGNEVRSVNFTGKQITLEKGDLTDGIYFYQLQTPSPVEQGGLPAGGRGEVTGKFIIIKQ